MRRRDCRKNLQLLRARYRGYLQAIDIPHRGHVGTAFASIVSIPANRCRADGSDSLNDLANLREGQLVEEIALLYRKVCNGQDTVDVRTKCAQAYLRELLRFKQESLELLRYQRAGRGARWQRRPELH